MKMPSALQLWDAKVYYRMQKAPYLQPNENVPNENVVGDGPIPCERVDTYNGNMITQLINTS